VCAPREATAATFVVNPGESIQAAVDAASAGDVVKVMPGDYVETHGGMAAVRITKRLKLIAKNTKTEKVRILPGAGNVDGIVVAPVNPGVDPAVERVLINGFTVEDFPRHGIYLQYANKFRIKNNTSANNLENGIFPTLSANGLVKKNVSYGALDSGLWVEASENVRVINNELYNNPTGLEITVSKDVFAKGNDIHDNTVGVGLYHPNGASLPPLGDDGDWHIIGNHIYNNNFPNPVMGGLVGALPSGAGVLLVGVDRVILQKNTIEGNDLVGIGVVDWCFANDCNVDPPIVEDKVDDNLVIANTVTGNGLNGTGDFAALASEILLITTGGVNNCFNGNTTTGITLNLFGPDILTLPTC
jgi:parallel beta-helix repeat protein